MTLVAASSTQGTRPASCRPAHRASNKITNPAQRRAVTPANLLQGATGTGSFDFSAGGLSFGDDLVFEVSFTADEIFPTIKTQTFTLSDAESDLQLLASKTWDFETDIKGWADVNNGWGSSSWTASALDSASYAGTPVQLDIAYDTDFSVNGKGFWFDQVTVTDVDLLVADGQFDDCEVAGFTMDADCDNGAFCNGAETCNESTDSCEGDENTSTCSVDCGEPPVPFCGNDIIEGTEVCDGFDFGGLTCSDGEDNDCDGLIDGADPDC